jgi:hypothetical protein
MGDPATSSGGGPGDFLIDDEEGGEAAPSGPLPTQPGDAGVTEVDAGVDSGSSQRRLQ